MTFCWTLTTSAGFFTKRSANLADMYQAVLVHTDINKGPEGGQVGYNAGESHPGFHIINFFNAFLKTEGLKPFPVGPCRVLPVPS